jgi:hypothetical protein
LDEIAFHDVRLERYGKAVSGGPTLAQTPVWLTEHGRESRTRPFPHLVLLALGLLLGEGPAQWASYAQDRAGEILPASLRPAENSFAGSRACAKCHNNIYEGFSRTSMGRSMVRVANGVLGRLPAPASVFVKELNQHFEVFFRDGGLYESQYQVDPDGKEIFRDTHRIEWIIGSGANGFGGLVRKGDYLFQAPLSFYSRPQAWDLSPGYEFGNYGFNRPILAGCIVCHSGRPMPSSVGNGRFEEPPFLELAIGCENCHGPGALHIQAIREGAPKQKKRSIINPAALAPDLANSICMFCHQTGDVRVLKPGKDYRDFKPGDRLDDTLSIFLIPPKPGAPPQSEHLEHYYSMTLSKCYRASGAQMRCITCHDPHVEPSPSEAPTYFAQKCLTCHSEKSCALSLETRKRHHPPDDCSGCHMPKRDIGVILHSTVTSHRILARPDEPLPDSAFHQTTPVLPDLIHLNSISGENVAPPRLTLLEAYGELMDNAPQYRERYLAILGELEQSEADNALVQAALGRRDLRTGSLDSAVAHLRRALELGPTMPLTYADLADALDKLGHKQETVSLLERAVELDPFNPVLQKTLALRLIELRLYPRAEAALEHYVEVFPQDSFMREMLARAKAGSPR